MTLFEEQNIIFEYIRLYTKQPIRLQHFERDQDNEEFQFNALSDESL